MVCLGKFSRRNLVISNLIPIIVISKVFGVYPYDSHRRYSLIRTVHAFLSLSFAAFLSVYRVLYSSSHDDTDNHNLEDYLGKLKMIMAIFMAVSVSLMTYNESKNFNTVVSSMSRLFKEFSKQGLTINYSSEQIYIIYSAFMYNFCMGAFEIYCFELYKPQSLAVIVFYYNLTIAQIFISEFIIVTHALSLYYRALNDKLFRLKTLGLFQVLLSFYYDAFRLCRKVNDLYAHRLLFFLTHVFLEMTVNVYFVIKHFKVGKLASSLASFLWIVYRILQTWQVVYITSATKRHAGNFDTNLRFLFSFLNFRKYLTSLLSIHFIIKPEIQFNARGFFSIDYPLFLSMSAATTGYLIFLIQSDK